jgi:UDP-N-acetylmuramoyl-tripeptide--D-alanyl-D-alanine ligase
MARLTLDQIAAAARGTLALGAPPPDGGGAHAIDGFSIDTRTLRTDDLFFAIVGPRVDGHDFVEQAIDRGAGAVVVARGGRRAGRRRRRW